MLKIFRFFCQKKAVYYLDQTLQVIFSDGYKFVSNTHNGFADRF